MGRKRIQGPSTSGDVFGVKTFKQKRVNGKTWCQIFRRLYWPVWVSLLCLVVILTLLNVSISLHLVNFEVFSGESDVHTWSTVNNSSNANTTSIVANTKSVFGDENLLMEASKINFYAGAGRYDNSRKYLIHDFVLRGENWAESSAKQAVTLATPTTVEHLFRLVELSQSWQGLLSVAVYVPGEDFHVAVSYLRLLTRCFVSLKQNLSVHFVYPALRPPKNVPGLAEWSSTCRRWSSALKELSSKHSRDYQRWRPSLIVPQNHLRNVARKACQTSFVFLVDVDVVPRSGLSRDLNLFLEHPSCERCAFVVPTYEVNENNPQLPENKSALLRLVKRNQSQPFHKSVFIHNQYATNSSIWESFPEGNGITVAYPVTNFELFYEPFYVSRDDVPPHDERFVGYGFTRNTQVYEMHVAGYKFVVLNYAFAIHRGFRKKRKKDPWREKQNRHNSILFKNFKKEVQVRYEFIKKM